VRIETENVKLVVRRVPIPAQTLKYASRILHCGRQHTDVRILESEDLAIQYCKTLADFHFFYISVSIKIKLATSCMRYRVAVTIDRVIDYIVRAESLPTQHHVAAKK
jgi:hypothetical protein